MSSHLYPDVALLDSLLTLGLTNALVLLPVLEFNLPAAEKMYAELGRAILPSATFKDDAEAARAFIDACASWSSRCPSSRT